MNPSEPPSRGIAPLLEIMAQLRDPVSGCSWDVQQTFRTIAPYTIEEAYEVADACERDDMAALKDELGDLLLQTVFHARMAEESGLFDFGDVVDAICAKMVRRHPHVFADAAHGDWEGIKERERKAKADDASALSGVALNLPSLLRAEKIQKRAARTGFAWSNEDGAIAKIHEEISEVKEAHTDEKEAEIGDLLFAVVNWARHLGIDPEQALRNANGKFERRFRTMEAIAGDAFSGLSLDEKEALWRQAKARD